MVLVLRVAFVGFNVGEGIAEDLGLDDKPFFKLGIQMGTSIMTGIAFQMATTAAIGKIINVIRGFALSAAMNEALKSTGFKMGAAMQKGLLVGLSVGMVAAISAMVSEAAQTAIDAVFDKAGRLLTGETQAEQQDSRISSSKERGNLTANIARGFIKLDKASLDTLIMLSKNITSLDEGNALGIPATLGQLVSGKSNLQIAIEKLEKVLKEKGINVEIAKKSFGNATPPGFGAVSKFSTGGPVNGTGTGTSDDIPAMLSDGEFVMKQSAVQKFGSGFMSAINNGIMPKFRAGGGDIGRFTLGGQAQEISVELKRDDLDVKERKALIAQLDRITRLTEQQTADLLEGGSKGEVVLDNLKSTSETAKQYAENFNNQLATALSRALHGDDLGDIGKSILDTFTSTVIDSFSQGFADKFLENFSFDTLFDGIGNLGTSLGGLFGGSGGGGGFDFGSLISSGLGFFGFSQGGVVPSTSYSQAGKDSVPAMLMPGEVVLSKNDVRNMGSTQASTQQTFSINVQGDVSRQTRQEIVKMMPQIAGGVNAQNKENNFR